LCSAGLAEVKRAGANSRNMVSKRTFSVEGE
jgi:hypothetical protein